MNDQEQQARHGTKQFDKGLATGLWLFVGLHILCCGIPLLLLAGVSFSVAWPTWPAVGGVLMVLGIVGFVWYMRRGCAACARSEGEDSSLEHADRGR